MARGLPGGRRRNPWHAGSPRRRRNPRHAGSPAAGDGIRGTRAPRRPETESVARGLPGGRRRNPWHAGSPRRRRKPWHAAPRRPETESVAGEGPETRNRYQASSRRPEAAVAEGADLQIATLGATGADRAASCTWDMRDASRSRRRCSIDVLCRSRRMCRASGDPIAGPPCLSSTRETQARCETSPGASGSGDERPRAHPNRSPSRLPKSRLDREDVRSPWSGPRQATSSSSASSTSATSAL